MNCRYCGLPVDENAFECRGCGAPYLERPKKEEPPPVYQAAPAPAPVVVQMPPAPAVSRHGKWVVFALCFFFGIFGVHRFVVGKVGSGFLYLFTGGIWGIGWLIDIIAILTGNFRDKQGQRLA